MKRIVRLTESDLHRIVKIVLNEQVIDFGGLELMPDIGYSADGVPLESNRSFEAKKSPASIALANARLAKTRIDISKIEGEANKSNQECNKYKAIKRPNTNTKDIQDFLISFGHKINNDNRFGDKTATALGTYFYGYNKGINSVNKLIDQLKIEGYVINKTGGLQSAVSKKINKIIDIKLGKCYNDSFKRTEELKKLKSIENEYLKKINNLKHQNLYTKSSIEI